YGYCKNHKKTVKAGQLQTRDGKECTRAEDLIARKVKSQLQYGYCKNHKKTVKAGQSRTRDGKECTRAEDLIARKNIQVISFTMKMEILLEPTSNKIMFDESDTHVLERFNTLAGNPVKEILLKLNLPDHRSILTDSKMEVKLKNFKKDATLKLFKSTNQERYEHVDPEITSSQGGKVNKMAKRDYAWLMISRCSRSHSTQAKEQAQYLKSMITTSKHKLMIEVKDYELKTKVES
ncbi:hypothetical protein Tco_0256160, partial [Tanacetum coccineum]